MRAAVDAVDRAAWNVLARDFSATAPDQKWATDITEFNVAGEKLYLSACMDLYNGEIIAHRMARRPVFALVSGTLRAALTQSKPLGRLTVHSDQGWHYKMQPYRAMLARQGVTQSMSRKGNGFDNAVIESFFGTLKAEYFHLAMPSSVEVLEAGVDDYIRYYNHERIKLGLQGLSPVESSSMARLTPTPSGGMTCAASPSSVKPSRWDQANGAGMAEIGRTAAMRSQSEISARIEGAQPANLAKSGSFVMFTRDLPVEEGMRPMLSILRAHSSL